MANDIVQYESTDGREITFTAQEVKYRLCPNIDDKELAFVMALCQAQKLNPFTKDVYITKCGNNPAQIVTGKEVFTKRAQANPKFDGMEAGISVINNGKLVRREGSMVLQGEELVGGWCKVYVKGYRVPIFNEVAFHEYAGRKKDGTLNQMWATKGATMVRKVALCQSLREAFPTDFQGMYGMEEMGAYEMETEAPNTASESVTAPQTDESAQPIQADFAEVVNDEQAGEYIELCNIFAEICEKEFFDVHEAILSSTSMRENGASDYYEEWTPQQMEDAMNQLNTWITAATGAQENAEQMEEHELLDEDIEF